MSMNELQKQTNTNIQAKANLIWEIATHLVGLFKPHEYGKVILPMTVLKRFDDALKETKDAVVEIFYSELPEVIISHSGRITKGLLDALFAVGYDKNSIITIWRNAFDIMKLRFPNLDHCISRYSRR